MEKIKIGDRIKWASFDLIPLVSTVQGIEVECVGKRGKAVEIAMFEKTRNIILHLSGNRWCYSAQVTEIIN